MLKRSLRLSIQIICSAIALGESSMQSKAEPTCTPANDLEIQAPLDRAFDSAKMSDFEGGLLFISGLERIEDEIYTRATRDLFLWQMDRDGAQTQRTLANVLPQHSTPLLTVLDPTKTYLWSIAILRSKDSDDEVKGSQLIKIRVKDGRIMARLNLRSNKIFYTNLFFDKRGQVRLAGTYHDKRRNNAVLRVVAVNPSDGTIDRDFGVNGIEDRVIGGRPMTWVDYPQTVYGGFTENQTLLLGSATKFDCPAPHFRCETYDSFDALFVTGFGGATDQVYPNISVHEVNQMRVGAGIVDSQNRLILFGQNRVFGTNDFFIAAIEEDGNTDLSFGKNGLIKRYPNPDAEIGYVIDLLEQGATQKLLAVAHQGNRKGREDDFDDQLTVVRFTKEGAIDRDFYDSGTLSIKGGFPLSVGLDLDQNCLLTALSKKNEFLNTTVVLKSFRVD